MQRRRFLQLAAGAAAGAAVPQLFAPSFGLSLRSRPLLLPGVHATLISLTGDPLLTRLAPEAPPAFLEMIWERRFDSPDAHCQWVINGQPYTESQPLPLLATHRYRLRIMNATGQQHSVYMQQHSLLLIRVSQTNVSRALQDRIDLARYSAVDADIVLS